MSHPALEAGAGSESASGPVPVYMATTQGLQRRSACGPAVVNADSNIQALFDGVLYNREELAARLSVDHALDPASLLALAYRRWGERFLQTVRGTFVLILFDLAHRRVLAARDPLGVYPLFYSQIEDRLLFSTAVGALVAQPDVDRRPNRAALAEMLIGRWTSATDTPYAAIRRVCPGHCREWTAGGAAREWRYWRALPASGPFRRTRAADLDQFGHLFTQAVDRCLAGDPAGIWLSGGLDSCSVALQAADLAAAAGSPAPWGLGLDFPDPAINERRVQEAVARCLDLPLLLRSFAEAAGPTGLLAGQLELSRVWDVPIWNIYLRPYQALAEAGRARGCRVILTGGGGDEMLSVGPLHAADLIRRGDVRGVWAFYRMWQRSYWAPGGENARTVFWRYGLRALAHNEVARVKRALAPGRYAGNRQRDAAGMVASWIGPDPALRRELATRLEASLPAPVTGSFHWQRARHELDDPVLSPEAEELFELGRRVGVRVRQPFWDADLMAFLYHTPPPLLYRGGYTKALVRDSLARRCPAAGFKRQQKTWSQSFFYQTLTTGAAATWAQLGGTPALERLGLVEGPALHAALAPVLHGQAPQGAYRLWNVLRLEAWAQAHF